MMWEEKFYECPKCGKRFFQEIIKPNVFRCVNCAHYKDNNISTEINWVIPVIAVGIFISFIFSGKLSSQICPTRGNTGTTQEIRESANRKTTAITKAISGRQVRLDINGKAKEVVLCGLNSPAAKSKFFILAKQNLQALLDKTGGDNLSLIIIDNSGSMPIVELYDKRESISLNAQQIARGYATSSAFLARSCRDREQILAKVKEAQAQHKGIWQLF
jgi:endonuclease YncB( thermonuclease family)